MGHFENQIEERRNAEQQLLEDSFVKIAGIVMGRKSAEKLGDERIITKTMKCMLPDGRDVSAYNRYVEDIIIRSQEVSGIGA